MAQDWHLQQDESGDVFLIAGTTQINLGPRDDAFVRLADFMGDDYVPDQPPGYDDHKDPGDFGERK